MKLIFKALLLLNLTTTAAFAETYYANCVSLKGQAGGEILVGDEETGAQFKLVLSGTSFKTNINVYKGKVSGTFVKVAKNGSYQFSSPSLTEFADQSDIGNTFISKELMNGKSGKLVFSVRQLGDSDGSWWLNQNFKCTVTSKSSAQ